MYQQNLYYYVINKPFPTLVDFTSMSYPTVKCLAVIIYPTGNAFSGVIGNSHIYFLGGTSCFKKCPINGLVNVLILASPAPIYNASTPS